MNGTGTSGLGWISIFRLGLVQMALGAIVVLTTSTMNRIMVVELVLPAMLPGFLVVIHHALQLTRPSWGHRSDVAGRRTAWIIGGMATLAAGAIVAAVSIMLMETSRGLGIAGAVCGFVLIGLGVGCAGTSLLALLAKQVSPARRPAAATIVWVMMIVGFILTAGFAGHFLDPYSSTRLVGVTTAVSVIALLVATVAVLGIERQPASTGDTPVERGDVPFREALRFVATEPRTLQFAIFIFVSMIAFSAQDLILEPFAGIVFGLTPGQSTKLSSVQNMGVLLGMIAVPVCASLAGRIADARVKWATSLGIWTVVGCISSVLALALLAYSAAAGPDWPLQPTVFYLGLSNGIFAVGAIGSMMALAGADMPGREGLQMGVWGAAQAIAFGIGGFLGAAASDIIRALTGSVVSGYGFVFAGEAVLFGISAVLAARIYRMSPLPSRSTESSLRHLSEELLSMPAART
ncbi:MAG: BCD family MFS transporter [Hyphomicrobiaceae bacterium]